VENFKNENSELSLKLSTVEQQVLLLHVDLTNLQRDNESLRDELRKKVTQLDDILEILQKVIKDHYVEKKVM